MPADKNVDDDQSELNQRHRDIKARLEKDHGIIS